MKPIEADPWSQYEDAVGLLRAILEVGGEANITMDGLVYHVRVEETYESRQREPE